MRRCRPGFWRQWLADCLPRCGAPAAPWAPGRIRRWSGRHRSREPRCRPASHARGVAVVGTVAFAVWLRTRAEGVIFHVHAVAKAALPGASPPVPGKTRQHRRRWAGLVDRAGRKDGLKTQEEEAVAQRRESVRRLESLRTDLRTACDASRAFAQREGR